MGSHPHMDTSARMEYAPLEAMSTPLDLGQSPRGCAPLETLQPLPGCAPLEVGKEVEFLVTASEVGENSVFFLSSLCNFEVSVGWIAVGKDLLVQGRTTAGISRSAM